MTDGDAEAAVDLDPALAAGLDVWQRMGAEVHVLRARADSMRGPRRGPRALVLALRASELESELLSGAGIEAGARILREMEDHPAALAAIERWRYAQLLTERILNFDLSADPPA